MSYIPNVKEWSVADIKEAPNRYFKEVKECVEYILYDSSPMRKCDLYTTLDASKHYINKAFRQLFLEGRVSRIDYILKEQLKLQEFRNYYTSNPKYHKKWK